MFYFLTESTAHPGTFELDPAAKAIDLSAPDAREKALRMQADTGSRVALLPYEAIRRDFATEDAHAAALAKPAEAVSAGQVATRPDDADPGKQLATSDVPAPVDPLPIDAEPQPTYPAPSEAHAT